MFSQFNLNPLLISKIVVTILYINPKIKLRKVKFYIKIIKIIYKDSKNNNH